MQCNEDKWNVHVSSKKEMLRSLEENTKCMTMCAVWTESSVDWVLVYRNMKTILLTFQNKQKLDKLCYVSLHLESMFHQSSLQLQDTIWPYSTYVAKMLSCIISKQSKTIKSDTFLKWFINNHRIFDIRIIIYCTSKMFW